MEKKHLTSSIISISFNAIFMILMIIHLCMNVEYTAQIAALFMVISGAIKLINFFINADYSPFKLREIFDDSGLIILGFIYMIVKASPTTVCVTYGCIDIVDGIIGTLALPFASRVTPVIMIDTALCAGDIVFGGLLCAECLEGLKLHLIFLAVTLGVYIIIKVLEMLEERKRRIIIK